MKERVVWGSSSSYFPTFSHNRKPTIPIICRRFGHDWGIRITENEKIRSLFLLKVFLPC